MRIIDNFYEMDCQIFRNINKHYHHRMLNSILQVLTHIGGATFTIFATLILILCTSGSVQLTALASTVSLAVSHLPVAFMKKLYPRKRPYVVLDQINVLASPLKDHSFPSGHTTAVFSVVIPFMLTFPSLTAGLLPIAITVGISRVFLGLHYPSDVIAGSILGTSTGIFSYLMIQVFFPQISL